MPLAINSDPLQGTVPFAEITQEKARPRWAPRQADLVSLSKHDQEKGRSELLPKCNDQEGTSRWKL